MGLMLAVVDQYRHLDTMSRYRARGAQTALFPRRSVNVSVGSPSHCLVLFDFWGVRHLMARPSSMTPEVSFRKPRPVV